VEKRKDKHKRNIELENILNLLNSNLENTEKDLISQFKEPQYPVVFIVGVARSGSTLLYQYFAQSSFFSYPSNIISRFYKAPYIGSLIH
jgi:hypothetical protein